MKCFVAFAAPFLLLFSIADPVHAFVKRNLEVFTPCGTESCNSREACTLVTSRKLECVCKEGWEGDTCINDVNECESLDPKPCSWPGGYCVNRSPDQGLYACGCDTSKGHWRNGTDWNEFGVTSCEDVNECEEWSSPCAEHATCTNTLGRYFCDCEVGFIGDGFQSCVPDPIFTSILDQGCSNGKGCDISNSYCDTTLIEPKCRCVSGYFAGSLGLRCQDANECADNRRNNCHKGRSNCTNTIGSYYCQCADGYVDSFAGAEGSDCRQINECEEGGHDCDLRTEICIDRTPPLKWECISQAALSPSGSGPSSGGGSGGGTLAPAPATATIDGSSSVTASPVTSPPVSSSPATIPPVTGVPETSVPGSDPPAANTGISAVTMSPISAPPDTSPPFTFVPVTTPPVMSDLTAIGTIVSPVSLLLRVETDGFGDEIHYRLYDVLNQKLIWNRGNLPANDITVDAALVNPDGCYFFLLHDMFVDGICCNFGSGDIDLFYDGTELTLFEFEDVTSGSTFKQMAHTFLGAGCPEDIPFLPSAMDSTCSGRCGSSETQPTGCFCNCTMTQLGRSRNHEPAKAFGDCCPDYLAMCSSTPSPSDIPTLGTLEITYEKLPPYDGTLPVLTLFGKDGVIGSDSCSGGANCKISIILDSTGLVCSNLYLRVEETSRDWYFAENVSIRVSFDGTYVLVYEGNLFPSILSFNCPN